MHVSKSKIKCELCNQEVTKINYSKHLRRHQNHPESFIKSKYALKHEGLNCQFCGKLCKCRIGLANHERACSLNPMKYIPKAKDGFNNKGRTAWNKGLTKAKDSRVALIGLKVSQALKGKPKNYTADQKTSRNQKMFDTKRQRHNLNSSVKENKSIELLLEYYDDKDIVRHYKDFRYPYDCDVYIKSIDTFIEFNFHWTHGSKPYDQNDLECQEKLKIWEEKAKTSKFYANAIQTWTIRDVNKFEAALNGNLKYVRIYNDIELANFLSSNIQS